MASLILPMAVDVPVPTTTALQRPEVTWVPYMHAHMHNTCTTWQSSQYAHAHAQHMHHKANQSAHGTCACTTNAHMQHKAEQSAGADTCTHAPQGRAVSACTTHAPQGRAVSWRRHMHNTWKLDIAQWRHRHRHPGSCWQQLQQQARLLTGRDANPSSNDERCSVRHAHAHSNPQEVHVWMLSLPTPAKTPVLICSRHSPSLSPSHSLRTGC